MLVNGGYLLGESGALLLDRQGFIQDCTPSIEDIFEYPQIYLITRPIYKLIPYLADIPLMKGGDLNPKLRLLCRLGMMFDAIRRDSSVFASCLSLSMVGRDGKQHPRLTVTALTPASHDEPGHKPDLEDEPNGLGH